MAVLKWLDENFEEVILMIFLVLMACIMGIQVIMRYAFNASLTWSEEITRYFFIWSAFISTSYCIKKGTSIKIDQFTNMLPDKAKKVIEFVVKIVVLLFFAYLLRYSIDVVRAAYQSGQKSPALGIPMYLVQVSTVVGFSLSVVRIIQSLLGGFKRPPAGYEPIE
ncbi:TRAP-type C4-dicarboxylate transport system, small permease component [Anaerovirgula multivorans]|uniref:TRAP-type C4-dicarboxylate transport system, small permease component n=1 Tax=Anaerovirgula multivorans TaxID=312168 RepID=A0A239HHW1_9FIRM|nr:TRAP transporter small permease [Anaerovirgula multivorans]SNS80910.1 TRAP-type C4-dicarboxylate transport system, small permease component [Anaerovirgula multivorans]